MGISEQEFRSMVGNRKADEALGKKSKSKQSKGKQRGETNKTEREYYEKYLLPREQAGEVLNIQYESITFRLDENRKYTPDFVVTTQDTVELHEIKGGYERRDGRTRFLWAANTFWMFEWYYAQKRKDGWKVERVS